MRLDGYVHRGVEFNNAFWDGREMVFGDGDERIFTDFTKSLDVIGHSQPPSCFMTRNSAHG